MLVQIFLLQISLHLDYLHLLHINLLLLLQRVELVLAQVVQSLILQVSLLVVLEVFPTLPHSKVHLQQNQSSLLQELHSNYPYPRNSAVILVALISNHIYQNHFQSRNHLDYSHL